MTALMAEKSDHIEPGERLYTCIVLSADNVRLCTVDFAATNNLVASDLAFDLAEANGDRTGFELWTNGCKITWLTPDDSLLAA
jgi:hypothetical protein